MYDHDPNNVGIKMGIKGSNGYATIDIDLIFILGFNLITLMAIFTPFLNDTPVRPILGIILILFIPGYSLVAALFPGKADIGAIERIALSFGFSIATIPLIGLLLNYTPFMIRLVPLVSLITLFIITCTLIANWRRGKLPFEERFSLSLYDVFMITKKYLLPPDGDRLNKAISIVTILIVLAIVSMPAYFILIPERSESYTEFYILGPEGKIENYPTSFVFGEEKPILVNIINHERRAVNYDLAIVMGDNNTIYSEKLMLADNQTWEKSIGLKPNTYGTDLKVMFRLYADGNMKSPYRECNINVSVSAGAPSAVEGGRSIESSNH